MISIILYYAVIYPISRLPYFLLYRLSDLAYYVLFYLVGYRKKVVYSNLNNSFPNKSKTEIKLIAKLFYKHLADLVVESIKNFSISESDLKKRVVYKNPELLIPYFEEGKDVIIIGGHYNNWESVATAGPLYNKHLVAGIHKPLSNKFLNKKISNSREKFGMVLVPIDETTEFIKWKSARPKMTIFATDQSPSNPEKAYWTTFLNQETGVHFGTEKFAKELELPVFYTKITKVKRGFYEVHFTLIEPANPDEYIYGELTEQHTKVLEKNILALPQYWLWTHKRWKKKKPVKAV
ncbi:MAG: KDO2-lipid IV(A) lauroyltransferase [Limisphaerales bacterium]|jgi:KDO2-lipid IV(A) lauroyltransferase